MLREGDAAGGTDGRYGDETQRQREPGRAPVQDRFAAPVHAAMAALAGTAVGRHSDTPSGGPPGSRGRAGGRWASGCHPAVTPGPFQGNAA